MVESGQLEITLGTQEQVLEEGYYGSEKLPYTRLLSKRSILPPSPFSSPDYFDDELNWRRIVVIDNNYAALTISQEGEVLWHSQDKVRSESIQQKLSQMLIPLSLSEDMRSLLPVDFYDFLSCRMPLIHIASETLWEALVKGIIRQVITALQAKKVLHRFVLQYGEKLEHDGAFFYAFPTMDTILRASLDDLLACGLGFKAKNILQLAQILREQEDIENIVRSAPVEEALARLKAIKGVGDWTARVSYCDLTANWDVHPCDMAVRHWTGICLPGIQWKTSESDFQRQFLDLFGKNSGTVVAYLLIYGPVLSSALRPLTFF